MVPAERLEGLTLTGGWIVMRRIPLHKNATGGFFSSGYEVETAAGRKAFLKALDFTESLKASDPAAALAIVTEAFNFERRMLAICNERRLDRIVQAISDGKIDIEADGANPGGVVQYIIFELADGDIRRKIDLSGSAGLNTEWTLRSLHHIATGLKQLHGQGIAHQDLKPSNVLVFDDKISKVGDLGRASKKDERVTHDAEECAGDGGYAPPELHYGYLHPDWNRRRFGCDAYLLGSMVVFYFTGLNMTGLMFQFLNPSHQPHKWSGTYDDVLPYVRNAFDQAVEEFALQICDPELSKELSVILRELCDPDPSRRGHPHIRTSSVNPLALDRYVTRFDLLAYRAKAGQYKGC